MNARSLLAVLAFNMICLLYFFSKYNVLEVGAIGKVGTLRVEMSRKSATSVMNRLKSKLSFMDEPKCHKSVVLFGMRQQWKQFCTEMFPCKSLVEFPRSFTCPDVECSITIDYTEEPLKIRAFDLVVFTDVYEWMTSATWDWLHDNRTRTQRWVMVSQESPVNSRGLQLPQKYADVSYDWFLSYKTDSDFQQPYGYYEPFAEDAVNWDLDLRIFSQNKTQFISWIGSNCDRRLEIIHEVQKLAQVDTYGKCGDVEIPWGEHKAVFDTLKKYRFYLSLENSCCDDYITEKFWRALEMGVVPIVMGATLEQYTRLAPPKSFIHVESFTSLGGLVEFLLELQQEDEKYLEYFEWRKLGRVISYRQDEQYTKPIQDSTYCTMLKKYLLTPLNDQRKLQYYGEDWLGSCRNCSHLPVG